MPTTSKPWKTLLALTGAALVLGACASAEDLRAVRQPAMPPVVVAKASPAKPFFRNVAIQEIQGAPEFRWFDGGAVITTRPTRVQVERALSDRLARADLLAPSRLDSDYMLYVQFDALRGPNVWLGTDKLASARITFRLVRWRTGEVIREAPFEASYRAEWTGLTSETVRSAIAGPIGASKDRVIAAPGGALLGVALGYYVNQNLVASIEHTPVAGLIGAGQAALIGGSDRAGPGFASAFSTALAVSTASGRFSDLEAMLAGGAISAAGAAAGPVAVTRPMSSNGEITTAFDGGTRRAAATRGLIDLAFHQFMAELSADGAVHYKLAVSCTALNGDSGKGPRLRETPTRYAVDCPDARYNDSKTQQVYPSVF